MEAEAYYDGFAAAGTVGGEVEVLDVLKCLVGVYFFFQDLLPIGNVAESERYWDLEEQAYAGEGVGCQGGEA